MTDTRYQLVQPASIYGGGYNKHIILFVTTSHTKSTIVYLSCSKFSLTETSKFLKQA